ncbi:hypothetical protein E6Q11_00115 [Candidatus Dojkabacteria bacterium]|uniref:Uncharacterized protein n=1 Tax=Candidatus Dojkabacteria bacterium TaxID=2099670 RepID=A0A5C7JCH9_9BACT|nr:MAG: hypothetical protein E6Q11_00115 [Candidatus Dojkabacteria bacterium]
MNDQSKKRLCINCKHFSGNMRFPRCKAISFPNKVTGRTQSTDCHPERTSGTTCGPEGKLFKRGAV